MVGPNNLVWFKGEIIPISDAKVNVLSPTAQFGANVFEGLRAYWDGEQLYVFRLEEHVRRLQDSIRMMRMDSPFSTSDFDESIMRVLRANKFKQDVAIRQTVFLDGFGSWFSKGDVDMFVSPIAKGRQDPEEEGVSVQVSSWHRISENTLSPKVKMGANYMNSRLAQMEAQRNGYNMGVFLNQQGTVSEGPGSCLFIVRDNELITPPLHAGILDSITRKTVIEIVSSMTAYKVTERQIDRSELYCCDELFFVGSAVEVLHASSIDGLEVGNGKIGPITKEVKKLYMNVVRGGVESYRHWCSPVY